MNIGLILAIVFVGFIGAGVMLVGYAIYRALNKLIVNPPVKASPVSLKVQSEYNLLLARLLVKIRTDLNCCNVLVARFHNGGIFNNGLHMEKFSVYSETPSDLCPIMQDGYRDIFNTRYPEVFSHLVVWGEYICADVDDCTDINFRNDAKKCGYGSVNLFLVKQLDGTEEGFIGVNYRETHVMTLEERSKVTSELPSIRGFLNMTK
jgi:hypothetical protein